RGGGVRRRLGGGPPGASPATRDSRQASHRHSDTSRPPALLRSCASNERDEELTSFTALDHEAFHAQG
ncbi:MAG: hypothetical protein AB1505_36740, partial [Candidatus Latescibacterota bacterium]